MLTFVFLSEEHCTKLLIWPTFSTDVKIGALTSREEHRLRVFKHVVPSKMF